MITMTSPRKRSTDTSRCAGADTNFTLASAIAMFGALTVVTTLHLSRHTSICSASFDGSGRGRPAEFFDVKGLQKLSQELCTRPSTSVPGPVTTAAAFHE